MAALAKYSSRQGGFLHEVIALVPPDKQAVDFVEANGMRFVPICDRAAIHNHCRNSDIVQLQWWNHPQLDDFLRAGFPDSRLVAWCHVAGDREPHLITRQLLEYCDFVMACSPHTYNCPAIQSLPIEIRLQKTGMAYGAADFARLADMQFTEHNGFQVGYIGTVDFIKMHRDYVAINAIIRIPEVRFVVCGQGSASNVIQKQAEALGMAARFDLRGFVEDIRPVLSTLDVYGYPLCEDTYAASEINLQEVMFAGVPPVVFPHGGIKELVVNEFTGLVVRHPLEYRDAIEYLYHQPDERKRIGQNASLYARQIFSAERAAHHFNQAYERILKAAKREHIWSMDPAVSTISSEWRGALIFLENVQNSSDYLCSLHSQDTDELLACEERISRGSDLMLNSIAHYKDFYAKDPFLRLWYALLLINTGRLAQAIDELVSVNQLGLQHWRVLWYISQAAQKLGNHDLARQVVNRVIEVAPEFLPAQHLKQGLAA